MYLALSIVLCTLLGFILFMSGPLVGGFLAFGIVLGCIVRGLYLLQQIYNNLPTQSDKVEQAYEAYIEKKHDGQT
ncbi:hypothetical protein [Oceanobacillus halotolerans]|uniref:hypothetical protein n=1 Tax=Oceanobacillus halotolerans TaxID=2663380 RepID=UPI0013DAFD8A|nr:hypothetical protein [Oceanobacillus halotolerans]